MSIHWTQEQATVYPVVVLRKVGGILREDKFHLYKQRPNT